MKLIEIYWGMFGYPDLPPKDFTIRLKERYDGDLYMPRAYEIAGYWLEGLTVEELAIRYLITHERVRQCLWKAYRELS